MASRSGVRTPLTCKNCGTALHPADVDMNTLRARCRHCGWEFGKGAAGPFRQPAAAARSGNEEPVRDTDIPLPRGIDVVEGADRGPLVILVRRPGLPRTLILALIAVLWSGVFVKLVLTVDLPLHLAGTFLVPSLVAGYGLAVALLNRKTISVTPSSLEVRNEPLPWFGSRSIRRDQLRQLYVAEVVVRGGADGDIVNFELRAQVADDDVCVIGGFGQPQPALYLERKLEKVMKIADVPVYGEYPE